MPSGAKKRKAAKKKKENQPNNDSREPSASTHSHGEEEMKHQEDDIGDGTSPKSEEILGKEEELIEKEKGYSNPSSAERSKIDNGENCTVAGEGIVPVERNFKIEDGLYGKDGGIEGKSYDGGSRGSVSSKSSSSDDENQGLAKNYEAAEDIDIPLVVHSSATIKESDESVVVNVTAADSKKTSASMKQAEEGTLPQYISGAPPPYMVESMMKENGGEGLIHVDEEGGNSFSSTKAASEREDGETAHSVENTGATHDQKECVAQGHEYRLLVPQNPPTTTVDNRAEHERDHEITQPMLVSSTQLQKTSWKSCCGMFDVFSGSGA